MPTITLEADLLTGPAAGIAFDDMSLANTWEPTPDELAEHYAFDVDHDLFARVFAASQTGIDPDDDLLSFEALDLAEPGYDTEAFDHESLWVLS